MKNHAKQRLLHTVAAAALCGPGTHSRLFPSSPMIGYANRPLTRSGSCFRHEFILTPQPFPTPHVASRPSKSELRSVALVCR